jgi:hypothetical protein
MLITEFQALLMLSRTWNSVINMLSDQKAGLIQQALDATNQPPMDSQPS